MKLRRSCGGMAIPPAPRIETDLYRLKRLSGSLCRIFERTPFGGDFGIVGDDIRRKYGVIDFYRHRSSGRRAWAHSPCLGGSARLSLPLAPGYRLPAIRRHCAFDSGRARLDVAVRILWRAFALTGGSVERAALRKWPIAFPGRAGCHEYWKGRMSRILKARRVADFGRGGAKKDGGTAGCGVRSGRSARRRGARVDTRLRSCPSRIIVGVSSQETGG